MKYWESKLTYKEAQEQSKSGTAVLGNPAMRDVIWHRSSDHPLCWITDKYVPGNPEAFKDRLGWMPLDETMFAGVSIPGILKIKPYQVVDWVEHAYGRDPVVVCEDGVARPMWRGLFHD